MMVLYHTYFWDILYGLYICILMITLRVYTPLGIKGDYLWRWGRSLGVQAVVSTFLSLCTAPSQCGMKPELGRDNIQTHGTWASAFVLLPWALSY